MKCYLKAAFENYTMRPNVSNAFHDEIQDFLKGHLTESDTSNWDDMTLSSLDEICMDLSKVRGLKLRVRLNKFSFEQKIAEIKRVFESHFEHVNWTHIKPDNQKADFNPTEPVREYLFVHFPRFLLRLLAFTWRFDVVISPIELLEYNVGLAKYTVLLDPSLKGCVRKNRLLKAFGGFIKMVFIGIKTAYFNLSRTVRNCRIIRQEIEAYPNLPHPSPTGINDKDIRVM